MTPSRYVRWFSGATRPSTDVRTTAAFMFARKNKTGQKVPQTIAHRGYKAMHPENTMGAFHGAIAVGADAIETDIHLTKDGVVVLSHVRVPRLR